MKKVLVGLLIIILMTVGISTISLANNTEISNNSNNERNIVRRSFKIKGKSKNRIG